MLVVLKTIPITQQLAELASQFPFPSPSKNCIDGICHRHYAERTSQAGFNDTCQIVALWATHRSSSWEEISKPICFHCGFVPR